MAKRRSRGGSQTGVTGGQLINSGQLASGKGALSWAQSGGKATGFQSLVGSSQNATGKGSTGGRSNGRGSLNNTTPYSTFAAGGDMAPSPTRTRGNTPSSSVAFGVTSGKSQTKTVFPRVLSPKGYGGTYRLSKGY